MERIRVRSSNIASIGYDQHRQILEVEFLTSSIYQYYGVSESVFRAFINAQSHGKFLNSNIVNNYSYKQVK